MVIPNIEMEFNNFDIFWYFLIFFDILDLSSAQACHMVSVKGPIINSLIKQFSYQFLFVGANLKYIFKHQIKKWYGQQHSIWKYAYNLEFVHG